jgi:hypothetical protein
MDYVHPDWPKHATKVAVSAHLLLKWLDGLELPPLAEKERSRLKERLDLLHKVSSGGDPDFINEALRRFAADEMDTEP